jgi:AICAR transformylase/IMP cyclohydrolase PurH
VTITKRTRFGFRRRTQYAFIVRSSNHKVLAVSSESYNNIADAASAASIVLGAYVDPVLIEQYI